MKIYLTPLLLVAGLLANAQQSKDLYLTKNLAADNIQQVKCETTGGNISVAGVDGDARIEVYVSASNGRERNLSKDELKQRLEEYYDLSLSSDNHQLTAIARPKQNMHDWNHGLSISFKVYIPHNVSTNLRTSGGNVSLTAINGTQDFTTSGGNLDLSQLSGHIKGRTSGGNINFTSLKDDVSLTTSGGNIDAKNSQGQITISTSGGEIEMNDMQGTIKATTSGGNVHAAAITGDLYAHTSGGNVDLTNLSCSVDASTSGGNIAVNIKTLGKFVKVSNSGGNIDLEIPQGKGVDLSLSADKVTATAMNNFKGDIKKDRIEGSLNGGGIPINAHGGSRLSLTLR